MNGEPTCRENGRCRVVIENVEPEINSGRFAIKRTVGESVVVMADIFADGRDKVSAVLKYRAGTDIDWTETPMESLANDRWRGEFVVRETGNYYYTVEAWVSHWKSWQEDLRKQHELGQDIKVELQFGANLIEASAQQAPVLEAEKLLSRALELRTGESATGAPITERGLEKNLAELTDRLAGRHDATVYHKTLCVTVDRELARFGAWYEMFPRSFGPAEGKHGTFKDFDAQLPRIQKMGFDVLYLPPVHPIGGLFRKGKNNNPNCEPQDPGSPWAIGSAEGGHKAIHPQLGTLEDFDELIEKARQHNLEIAMDMALQCAPDHPYVQEHPEWFKFRPDGTIQCAENPPKIYQDIVAFDFECQAWHELWEELKSIFEFWIARGVKIFRVDNPHTKTFGFWEWCIAKLKQKHPDLIFLAEAFTRPKVMYELAKIGFSQSYNYFPWRDKKAELTEYFTELTQPPVLEFFRPNIWPNTPDILPQSLQIDGRAGFAIRFVLAATLGSSYGIYGPAFELCENIPSEPGAEEYRDSEKYTLKHWNLGGTPPLQKLITQVNKIRHEQPALQSNHHLRFYNINNDQIIAYSKGTGKPDETILTIVNLNPHFVHSGWLELPPGEWRIDPQSTCEVHDLLSDEHYVWQCGKNYVELNPQKSPAHIIRLNPSRPMEPGAHC